MWKGCEHTLHMLYWWNDVIVQDIKQHQSMGYDYQETVGAKNRC